MRFLVVALLLIAACQNTNAPRPDTPAPELNAELAEDAVQIRHGVENRVDGCTMSTFYIMNVEGTPTARVTWHCDGQDPQDPRQLVEGDCLDLLTQSWCVHAIRIVDEGTDEPGSSEDALILVPKPS